MRFSLGPIEYIADPFAACDHDWQPVWFVVADLSAMTGWTPKDGEPIGKRCRLCGDWLLDRPGEPINLAPATIIDDRKEGLL